MSAEDTADDSRFTRTAEPSFARLFAGELKRDLALSVRDRAQLTQPLIFFVVVITLFPLGVSPDPEVLASLAPGVLWISALLATLLGLDGLFRRDWDDGTLEQLVLGARPLYLAVLARVLAHWLVTGLPLTVLAPFLGVLLSLPSGVWLPTVAGLALGTPVLALLGAVGAALTVGLRRGGLLLSLLILPLYVPVLILGVGAAELAGGGLPVLGHLAWLGALLALAVATLPFAIAGALRISVEAG